MTKRTDTIERCLDAYNRHDGAAFASFFTEDGALRVVATGEVNEGRGGIEEGAEQRWQMLDYQLEPSGIFECGDDIWVEWKLTGVHVGEAMGIPATHRPVEILGCSHFTFAPDGLIAKDAVYFDFATMLRQLGVIPELDALQAT